ncbi:MAG: magnesium/cobalt transporter CorA [Acidimicrobiia bacterium]|nr:magnesium/cobalt transporter CorA [Acidimicrobiia bacterium]NNL27890.1 magnesium/cobalt transporter CorA [Acidimicrobiia bacterium]
MIVDCAIYENGVRRPGTQTIEGAASAVGDGFVWIGLFEPTEPEFEAVRKEFDLHELAVEDAISAHQRPKLEVYDDTLFVVLKTARYIDKTEDVDFGEINIFLSKQFIVVVRHGEASSLAAVRRRLEREPALLELGPASVLYAVMDRVVDGYAPVVDGLGKDIDEVEAEVFSAEWKNPAERIYLLKREVLEFQSAARSLLDPLERLMRGHIPAISSDIKEYFRDIHDHALRASTQVDQFRDLLNSILEANLTQAGVAQNEDMRKISSWVAVAVVPTLIAGIFGMNFNRMPGLNSDWGFPIVVLIMTLVAGFLYRAFRKSGWL